MPTKTLDMRAEHVCKLVTRHRKGSPVQSRFECSCGARGDWHSMNIDGRCASQYEGHIADVLNPQPAKVPRAPRVLQPCGTWQAFDRHKRRGEKPCDACAQAHYSRHAVEYMTSKMDPASADAYGKLLREYLVLRHGAAVG